MRAELADTRRDRPSATGPRAERHAVHRVAHASCTTALADDDGLACDSGGFGDSDAPPGFGTGGSDEGGAKG